jgi:SpoVK/Ycf46/Vps4 family AAA+-type ATPase
MTIVTGGTTAQRKSVTAVLLAARSGLPLFRVDLAAVAGKYIGETEKNLGRVLGQAESRGAVLLVEEADALFRRRSGRGDAGARTANAPTGALLQRIEAYPGIVILTTNAPPRNPVGRARRVRLVRL